MATGTGQHTNRGLVEVGAYATNKLHQRDHDHFYPWNPIPARLETKKTPAPPPRDRFKLARYYQSLLDSGKFESQAALARFLGVSRVRVMHVLKRLEQGRDSNRSAESGSDAEVA